MCSDECFAMKPLFLILWCVALLLPVPRSWGGEKARPSGTKLKVMIVAPVDEKAAARAWVTFLISHGLKVALFPGGEVDARGARPFDIVLLLGSGRGGPLLKSALDLGRPVLGLGPYACKVFGAVNLKNGYPYT